MVGHWDSFSGNANNYYFYRDPGTEKFYFLPWGPDAPPTEPDDGAFGLRWAVHFLRVVSWTVIMTAIGT